MKVLIAALSLTALFTAASASAADGYYFGTGSLEIEGRYTEHCERVSLDISEDSWAIYIRQFEYDCNGVHGELDPHRFDVRGNDVYFNGERVGTRFPGRTEMTIRDPQSNSVLGLRFNDYSYDTVDVTQELAAPGFAQRMRATLRRQ